MIKLDLLTKFNLFPVNIF